MLKVVLMMSPLSFIVADLQRWLNFVPSFYGLKMQFTCPDSEQGYACSARSFEPPQACAANEHWQLIFFTWMFFGPLNKIQAKHSFLR